MQLSGWCLLAWEMLTNGKGEETGNCKTEQQADLPRPEVLWYCMPHTADIADDVSSMRSSWSCVPAFRKVIPDRPPRAACSGISILLQSCDSVRTAIPVSTNAMNTVNTSLQFLRILLYFQKNRRKDKKLFWIFPKILSGPA